MTSISLIATSVYILFVHLTTDVEPYWAFPDAATCWQAVEIIKTELGNAADCREAVINTQLQPINPLTEPREKTLAPAVTIRPRPRPENLSR